MSHVFLSYSRRNSEAAFRIYDHLQSMGIPVWIDQRSIRPGASYAEEIFLAINSASAVVLLLTASSNESREIHREIQLAANANVPVIPLRLEPVTYHPALGYFLAALQWIDATSGEDRARSTLLDQLRRLVPSGNAGPAVPPQSVTPPLDAAPALPAEPSTPTSSPPAAPLVSGPIETRTAVESSGTTPSSQQHLAAGISLQQQLATAILALYPNGKVKKIDQDHYVDIFLPSVCPRPATHLGFKTARGVIQVFFYCRSAKLVEYVLRTATHVERFQWGLRLMGNPSFTDPDEAVRSAVDMLNDIARAGEEDRMVGRP
jgi:hypothetical protein